MADNFNDTITILVNQTAAGDPLISTGIFGQTQTVYTWGIVAGAQVEDDVPSRGNALRLHQCPVGVSSGVEEEPCCVPFLEGPAEDRPVEGAGLPEIRNEDLDVFLQVVGADRFAGGSLLLD